MTQQMKRLVAVWHRRAGKDSFAINATAVKMVTEPGLYYYLAPSQKHARKIIWDNIGSNGQRVITQAIPEALRKSSNDQEMRIVIDCPGGGESIFQVVGSDNFDSIVGSNPKGLVFSEWSICQKPEAWDYFRPILAENGGWAMFIYTPRGLNHGYHTFQMAQNNPQWYCERLTIEDTGVLSKQQVEDERAAGMSELRIRQEFYCEFNAANENQIFDVEDILACQRNRIDPHRLADHNAPCIVGIDVARFGDDRSVIATRIGSDAQQIDPIVLQKRDIVTVANIAAQHCAKVRPDAVFVDATGLGAGVVDVLRRNHRIPAVGIHFSQKAALADTYRNIRTEMYDRFREWTEDPNSLLYDNEGLREELAAIQFEYDPSDLMRLETKDKAKERLGCSPDLADAYALTFARHVPRKDAWQFRGRGNAAPQKAVISW